MNACVCVCLCTSGLVFVNRIYARECTLCAKLCPDIINWQFGSTLDPLHLVGQGFVLSSDSVWLRGGGLLLGLAIGLWLNSRMVRRVRGEKDVGFI